jgi:hypothetical protein
MAKQPLAVASSDNYNFIDAAVRKFFPFRTAQSTIKLNPTLKNRT